jgi:hypothetical protein
MITIYIRLLNEGTEVFRPVPSEKIGNNIYVVGGNDFYDLEDEEWEFTPGTRVRVTEKLLGGLKKNVAFERC